MNKLILYHTIPLTKNMHEVKIKVKDDIHISLGIIHQDLKNDTEKMSRWMFKRINLIKESL